MKLWAIIPELITAGISLALVPLAGFAKNKMKSAPVYIAIAGLSAAGLFAFRMLGWQPFLVFEGTYAVDPYGNVFKILIFAGSIITLLIAAFYFKKSTQLPHIPVAIMFAALGAVGITSSMDLGLIALFLQMMSLAAYVLVGAIRTDPYANEAALKYFIFAAISLALMIFGLTFLYGLTGSMNLSVIGSRLSGSGNYWILFALSLVILGYGFELTLVPFHFWAPDVYSGTSAPIAGFVSVVPKIAGFAGLARILTLAFPNDLMEWSLLLSILAAATMTFGNIAALKQNKLKRLLAYSSIAQSGYIIIAVSVLEKSETAFSAVGFYIIAYVFMNLGAFAVAAQIERNYDSDDFVLLKGLGKTNPFCAIVLALSLLSLAGIPPLTGFAGKIFLLKAAMDAGFIWLAVIAIINMTIGLYYYVSIISNMYTDEPLVAHKLKSSFELKIVFLITLLATIFFGVFPSVGLELTGLIEALIK